ncbi:23S rRNA (uracil(1939)-C(5))-methyltransferase RlmD [Alteromonas facilis]|uniref:23S rRNA (uracil(1939)-C(5))-methyltransferase RlmD n=1 Tax=Alteromonas facilis TaxID=2048004 RepID=UPI000C281B1E|nr:23S rRNA (uracil(1939)-C(5))-methyltransferase RlmD [Alteromonas facilis]
MVQIFKAGKANKRQPSKSLVKGIKIEQLDHTGVGIVKQHAPLIFVQDALPGEVVDAQVSVRKKHYWHAKTTRILTKNSARQAPFCPHSEICGGCQMDFVEPEYLRTERKQAIAQLLQKIAGIEEVNWQGDLFAPPLGYRRKARLAVDARDAKNKRLGYRKHNSNAVFSVESCKVLTPKLASILPNLRKWFEGVKQPQAIGHINLYDGDHSVLVHIRATKALSPQTVQSLEALGKSIEGVITVAVGDNDIETIWGDPVHITYSPIEGVSIRVNANDFVQVNDQVNRQMVAQTIDWLKSAGAHSVLDLFSGTGNFSLALGHQGFHVQGIEGVADMVERAQQNAQQLALKECKFACADLLDANVVETILQPSYDAVLLDPSREGAPEVCQRLNPATHPVVVYVSCNPASFARDTQYLINSGYTLEKIRLIEMFAYTKHTELMACFSA